MHQATLTALAAATAALDAEDVATGQAGIFAGALCAQSDPEQWFPELGRLATAAKAICSRCPARTRCLDWAVERPDVSGVWGGTTVREREEIRAARRGVAA